MMTILDEIAAKTRIRIDRARAERPLAELSGHAKTLRARETRRRGAAFQAALLQPEFSFICEVKQASPSAGRIVKHFNHLACAQSYETAGADALSVLTEPDFFLGDDRFLSQIAAVTALPVLRKDFILDVYQIYQSYLLGASAVLLLASLLTKEQLRLFGACADELGLAALVEVHDASELDRALAAEARIIGINNRNLANFEVSLETTGRLRAQVPSGLPIVAESGIRSPEDAARMRAAGADAVLVGEALMRAADVGATLCAFRDAARRVEDAAHRVEDAAHHVEEESAAR